MRWWRNEKGKWNGGELKKEMRWWRFDKKEMMINGGLEKGK